MVEKKAIKNVKVLNLQSREMALRDEELQSKQMTIDPFAQVYGDKELVKPPYDMQVLLNLRESNPIHSACISAKVNDIAGMGFDFAPLDEVTEANQEQYKELKRL